MNNTLTHSNLIPTQELCSHSLNLFRLSPRSGFEPDYNPDLWNSNSIKRSTNCYAYALNLMRGFKQDLRLGIGMLSGHGYLDRSKSPKDFLKLLEQDVSTIGGKIIPISFDAHCPENMYKIAVVFSTTHPRTDFHFYRLNPDGTWSHKQGGNEVGILDGAGKIITNPEDSNRQFNVISDYNLFLGYFAVTRFNTEDKQLIEFVSKRTNDAWTEIIDQIDQR